MAQVWSARQDMYVLVGVGSFLAAVAHGHITKRGSKLGRTTLVQCTLIAVRYSSYLKRFYERLKQKKGAGKAIIATARKFLGILSHIQLGVADFPNFVLAED